MISAAALRPRSLPLLGAMVGGFTAALLGAATVTGALGRLMPLAVLAGAAALLCAATVTNWRTGVHIFLAWLLIEDLPRKFLGNDMRLYFAKDVLAVLVYGSFLAALVRGKERCPRVRFFGLLLVFAGWGFVQVFNPRSPSLLYGLVGLRMYFFYIPLLFVGYALLRDEREVRRFLLFNLALASVIAVLGIAQGIIGLDFLNPPQLAPELNLGHLVREAPITGVAVPRATSVFVSDARFAFYSLAMLVLGVGAVAYLVSRRARGAGMAAAAVAAIAVAVLVSGRRGPFVYALVSVGALAAAFGYGAGSRTRLWGRRALALGFATAGLALAAAGILYPETLAARWAFYYETMAPWSQTSELAARTWSYPVGELLKAFSFSGWPLGYGIGTASLGVQYVTALGLPAPDIAVENGYGTLILELGIIGPLLWLLWSVGLLREAWGTALRLRRTPLFPLGCSIVWFVFLLLVPFTFGTIGPYQDYVLNAYFWLLTGILFRLPAMADSFLPSGGAGSRMPRGAQA